MTKNSFNKKCFSQLLFEDITIYQFTRIAKKEKKIVRLIKDMKIYSNISRKEKCLVKRVFVFVFLLCLKMLMFVLFYINPCVFTSNSASWICTCDLVCAFLVKFETFVWCSVDHCDAWEVFKDHRPI